MPTNAVTQVNHLNQLVHTFNWHTPSWDLFIILFWIVASVMYAFAAGRGRILVVLLSVYISKLLVLEAPFLTNNISKHLQGPLAGLPQLVTFVLLFLILFVFLGRYMFRTSADGKHLSHIVFGTIFALLQIGLLINTILGYLPAATQENFTTLIKFVFLQPTANFIWLVLPLAFLVLLGKFISDRSEI